MSEAGGERAGDEGSGELVRDLSRFLHGSPTPFHAVEQAASRLLDQGWVELARDAAWSPQQAAGPALVRRGGALVAWGPGDGAPGAPLRLVGAHTDSPGLRLRPRADGSRAGWRTLRVEVYGGALWNSWLDRDLRLAGRLAVVEPDGGVRTVLVDTVEGIARVPQLAIHLDREVNSAGLRLDPQRHLDPVWALERGDGTGVLQYLSELAGVEHSRVLGADVGLVDAQPPALLGAGRDLLASGRLDDLSCVWAGLRCLTATRAAGGPNVPILVCWDHEEVGSETSTGAAGTWLASVLERRAAALGGDRSEFLRSLAASRLVSADVAHAVHPNHVERHDHDHQLRPGGGPAVKHNANARYATDAPGAAGFVAACDAAGVPVQHYSHRNDLPCGSTVGPLVAAGLALDVVGVGPPILSMRSARERVAGGDVTAFVEALTAWTSLP